MGPSSSHTVGPTPGTAGILDVSAPTPDLGATARQLRRKRDVDRAP
ncbi:hypothetical protein, partial [Microbacterium lacticum]